jgi:hypothetical protein
MATNQQDYFKRPDGEHFVDTPAKVIPPADTWDSLSTNQLIEIQVNLQTKAWEFRGNPAISTALNASLGRLQALVQRKLLDNS